MQAAARISVARLASKVGREMRVLVDRIEGRKAIARSAADAPEIDGVVRISGRGTGKLEAGDWADVTITGSDDYDLQASLRGTTA